MPSAAGAIPASRPAQPLRSPKGQELLELLVQHLAVEPLGKARLISEFWIPVSNARADLVVANGVLDGYEIKAPSDRLHRLPTQVVAYGRIFDHCTAVLAERHVAAAIGILPDWWGVSIVTKPDSHIEPVRPAGFNPCVDLDILLRLLWRHELEKALTSLGKPADSTASRAELRSAIASMASPNEVRAIARHAIIDRADSAARIPTRRYAAPLSSLS